jgi:RNA polymerase sigma factor (sigma-70 family)
MIFPVGRGVTTEDRTDGELLRSTSPEAFAAFYRRHLPWVLHWLHSRVRDRELAADLAGEVFASALQARADFDDRRPTAEPWLQVVARNVLIDSLRRGRVQDGARRKLGMTTIVLSEDDLDQVDELIDQARGWLPATVALGGLPPEQAEAVRARVLAEEDYGQIAERLECSPSVARQRVSRGLRALRATLEGEA